MASRATAYGAWPDNPIPIHEDWRLKAREHFQYAADKTAIEASIKALAGELPDVAVSWTRPVIMGGKGVDNDLSRFLLNIPIEWIFATHLEIIPPQLRTAFAVHSLVNSAGFS